MKKYEPKEIEPKWQKFWEQNKTFEVTEDKTKKKFYPLIEFPYPSGAGLHVGHPRPFTAMDVVARKRRMGGYNVLYPIGFDAFGLPTENYAIKTGRPPAEITAENIANFTRQLKSLGYSFAWDRVVDTTDPKYYKWTQWQFLQFFKHGLAYKKNQPINWCPKDKIGLANEEVVNGCCERCGTPVEKRNKEQWMLGITKYADKLLEGLKDVDYITPARVQQENWIGKSEGAEITFELNVPGQEKGKHKVTVFTTRPDTLFGVTFLAISADLAKKWIDVGWNASDEVKKYVAVVLEEQKKATNRDEELEKTGVETGVTAINPANGEEVPVWVTNYVLPGYGTGALMAVPGHDERDWEFAKKYNLEIKEVVIPVFGETKENEVRRDSVAAVVTRESDNKILVLYNRATNEYEIPSGGYDGNEKDIDTLRREIAEESGYVDFEIKEYLGQIETHFYALRRKVNRIKHHKAYHVVLKSEKTVSLTPDVNEDFETMWLDPEEAIKKMDSNEFVSFESEFVKRFIKKSTTCFTDDGVAVNSDFLDGLDTKEAKEKIISWLEEKKLGTKKVNYKLRDWVFSRQRYWGEPIPLVHCESCAGWIPLPENQLPLTLPKVPKYEPTDNGESPLAAITGWVNTTCPKCGGPAKRETDTMPNWAGSSWYFLRYCDPHNDAEVASKENLQYWMNVDWYNGGMEHTVLHLLYSRFWNQFMYDIGVVTTSEPYKKRTSHGLIMGPDGEKMSKSRGNVINPDEMVDKFGADALRAYIMFMGPFDQHVAWDTNGLVGVRRFIERVWSLQDKVESGKSKEERTSVDAILHQTIKKVGDDIEKMSFNTAISALMTLTNEMMKEEKISSESYCALIKLLSPFCPHVAEELWSVCGDGKTLSLSAWPQFNAELAKESTMTIAVQVNGKVRDELNVSADISEEEIKKLVLASDKIMKWLDGKEPKKVIYVKGKLVSVVI